VLEEVPAAALLADADGLVEAVNQAFCDLFELAESASDLIGTDCRLLLRPLPSLVDDPAGFVSRLEELIRRRRPARREGVMFADGRVFERSHVPVVCGEESSGDSYAGHLWIYVDVTARRILEAETEGLIAD
jgi:PAS domain-containing protein